MEFIALRTFQAVVEEGGILSASRKLNTVQSNVTNRIKRLEEELGSELFYRKGRGLELAPSGKVLLEYTRQLLQLESRAGAAVRQVGEQSGELRIGSMESFAALRLPPLLKSLREAHNGVDLFVQTDRSGELVNQVSNHKLDCAFVGGPVNHPDLVAVEVLQEELVLVRAKHNRQEKLPLILFREGCAYRARSLAWQREAGYQTDDTMELGTLDGILGCVAMGLGCTLMPHWIVTNNRHCDDLEIETIAPHLANIPTTLIYHRNSLPMKAIDTLIQQAREQKIPGDS